MIGDCTHREYYGQFVDSGVIFTIEKPFDLKALSTRLEKVFPTMIKLYEDEGFIWVMEKIKVTEKGVVEGSGPIAERAQRVYNLFTEEAAAK